MYYRSTFHFLICVAVTACIPTLQAQESRSTRIQRAARQVIDHLDPSAIESELIEATGTRFGRSTSGIQSSTRQFIDQTTSGVQNTVNSLPRIQPDIQSSFNQNTIGQSTKNSTTYRTPVTNQTNRTIQLQSPQSNIQTGQTTRNQIYNSGTSQQAISGTNQQRFQQPTYNRNTSRSNFSTVSMPSTINSDMYETKSAPTIQTQIVAPRTINVNQTARFFIQAQNIGNENVPQVKLIATLPEHAKFISANPAPSEVNGRDYIFAISSLTARAKQVIQIDVAPTEKLPLNIGTQVRVESQQQVAVTVQQPILQLSISGPDKIQTGQPFKHTVTVKNIGDGTAEAVRLDTQRPHEIISADQNPKTLVPKLIPGQSAKFELSSFAKEQGTSNLIFQVSARGAESRQADSEIRVIRPELGVQVFGPGQNYIGRTGIYTIQLQNTSELPIDDVNVSLAIPSGLEVDTISQQAKIDDRTGLMTWKFDNVAGNEQQVIQFRAKAVRPGKQTCQVDVRTKQTGARQMSLSTEVLARADLSIRVTDSGAPVGIGAKSEFSIEVANHGTQTAEQVNVQVELPSALMPVNQSGYNIDPAGNTITFNNISVEAGKRQTLKFKVVAVAEGEHIVRGTVSLEGSTQSISSENSIFVFETENAKVSEALVPQMKR